MAGECDIDDIMCQVDILKGLRIISGALGNDEFISRFPELEGLGPKITEGIQSSQIDLKETLDKCGLTEFLQEEIARVMPEEIAPAAEE